MTSQRQREIVIEFEKVRLIRKRAKTILVNCSECGAVTDMVLLVEAAALFETAPEALFLFTKKTYCHYLILDEGSIYICVVSLLESMKRRNNIRLALAKGQ